MNSANRPHRGDPNMAFALALACGLGTACRLPAEFEDVAARARFADRIDGPFIATYDELADPVAAAPRIGPRLREIAEAARKALGSVPDELDRLSGALRLWSGCLMAAKTIALETRSGPNTPEIRRAAFEEFIDPAAASDSVFRAGVEAGPAFKALRGEPVSLEGVPAGAAVRRYVEAVR
mgnify:CR=1 FL=1